MPHKAPENHVKAGESGTGAPAPEPEKGGTIDKFLSAARKVVDADPAAVIEAHKKWLESREEKQ